jgi:DNA-binding YbaB/EbfC family protein
MLGGLGNMLNLMKNAKEIQANIKAMQEELANKIFEADAGGGLVKAFVNGKGELVNLKLDPSTVKPEEVELLEDLIKAAISAATLKAREGAKEELAKVTGGMGLPDLSSMMPPE